jgi:hypothetical protein
MSSAFYNAALMTLLTPGSEVRHRKETLFCHQPDPIRQFLLQFYRLYVRFQDFDLKSIGHLFHIFVSGNSIVIINITNNQHGLSVNSIMSATIAFFPCHFQRPKF